MPAISQAFRCFDEVARRGSVRQAALHLHLTAAAVNQQILNLEAQVGARLFDRLPRGMQLTAAGDILLGAVRRSQRDFDDALHQLEDLQTLRRGHVNVGVAHATAEYLLPQVIETLHRSHPGITFGVRTGSGEALLRHLASGEVDVAYCLRRPPPPGVEEVRAWAQQLGVVSAPAHPLAHHPGRRYLRDCLDYPLILITPDMELRSRLDAIEPGLLQRGRPLVETSSVPMVRRLVANSQALGFLVPDNVAEEVAAGRLAWQGLDDAGAQCCSAVYQRTGHSGSAAMALFLEGLEHAVGQIRHQFESLAGPAR